MIICGIISEYNPFHNGHMIHIEQSRKKTDADLIVCVMSGNFVQRGEPAIFDKYTRAYCALLGGADAVVELPFLSAVQSAEGFASGGIKTLNALSANYVSFGCETEDIKALKQTGLVLSKERRAFRKALKENLSQGMSFPKARMLAAFPEAPEELQMPNAILALEYIKALNKSKSLIEPVAIKRVGQSYHSEDISTQLSSATAIRAAIEQGSFNKAFASMPKICSDYIIKQLDLGLVPIFASSFDRELIFRLRQGGAEYIRTLQDVSEGLENRIYDAAKTSITRQELIDKIKTKRYTYTRISRILLYALFGITRELVQKHNKKAPDYVHILGVKNTNVMSALTKSSHVPIVIGKSDLYPRTDLSATGVYALTQNTRPFNAPVRDFTQKLIILE